MYIIQFAHPNNEADLVTEWEEKSLNPFANQKAKTREVNEKQSRLLSFYAYSPSAHLATYDDRTHKGALSLRCVSRHLPASFHLRNLMVQAVYKVSLFRLTLRLL